MGGPRGPGVAECVVVSWVDQQASMCASGTGDGAASFAVTTLSVLCVGCSLVDSGRRE